MAGKKKRRYFTRRLKTHRRKSTAIPLIPTMAGLVPVLKSFSDSGGAEGIMANPSAFAINTIYEYTGYDSTNRSFNVGKLLQNALMWASAYGAHIILNRVGVNRAIKRVPVIGKYISL